MANRNVFKIFSSIGPGGCIINFCEKICRSSFFEAYDQGDPRQQPSLAYKERAAKLREEYVKELFDHRSRLERNFGSTQEDAKIEAYRDLVKIIAKHKQAISKAELSRLARERLFYEPNSIQYRNLVEKSKRVNADTIDNLIKMALHINKLAKPDKLREVFIEQTGASQIDLDLEEGTIEERIPENRARDLLLEWKKILYEYKNQGGDLDALFASQGNGAGEALLVESGST